MAENVVEIIRLTRRHALEIIRDVAQDSANVAFKPHARTKMRKRRITDLQVINCLRRGSLISNPIRGIKGN